MSKKTEKFICVTNVRHDGKLYEVGSDFTAEADKVERLLELGAIKRPGDKKDEGDKDGGEKE